MVLSKPLNLTALSMRFVDSFCLMQLALARTKNLLFRTRW